MAVDRKLYTATLYKQGEYLGQLVTELTTTLHTLEQTLSEGNTPLSPDATGLLQGFEGLQRRLSIEAEMLCKRLQVFLAEARIAHGSPAKKESP
jgi:hypothetical protein